ncbi:MAG TPA: VIT domain-containing protein, partial [Verrucomicrobiae bacterium]|nr:VIT domain-containing protein [Verrucomicrobiae bacterium]
MKRLLFCLAFLIALVGPAFPAGLIVVHDPEFWPGPIPVPPPSQRIRPPRPILPPVWAPLEVSYSKVDVQIKDQVAVTKVDQEFYNPNARQVEGTFLFPVPRGAQLDRFTMEINGKPVEAELLAADKARGIYEDIVRKLKDPALLEYSDRDLFKVRIFPIEPHGRKKIQLSYSQVLRSDSGLINYV